MLTVMSLNLRRGAKGRWSGLADIIRSVDPDVLLLQEANGWYDEPEPLATAQRDLAMVGRVAPSKTGFHTAIMVNDSAVGQDWILTYNHTSLHGHAEATVTVPDLAHRLVLISAHLTPYSAASAAAEASILVGRAHRTGTNPTGGWGILGGDINHIPPGDRPPAWDQVPPHDRSARSIVSETSLRPNTIVGDTLTRGDLVDVAAHLATTRQDPSLRDYTGRIGQVRTDQIHVTRNLLPAVVDYQRIDTGEYSDHDAVVAVLNLNRIQNPTS